MNKINKYFFSHGRTALKYGLLSLNITKNDEVLVPDYNCIAFYQPFIETGIKTVNYKTGDNFSIDLSDLTIKINKKTKAIVLVHFFGFNKEIYKIKKICNERNLLLIEDKAHGFGEDEIFLSNQIKSNMVFLSPRKKLNLRSGAILYLKR